MTVARRLAFLVISLTAIVGIVAAQSAPKQKVTEKRSLDSKETKPLGQDHLSADKIVPPLAEQQSAPISNTQTAKSGEDIEIQRKLVKFTKWLAIVGALQFLALIVQAIVFWRTLDAVKTQANIMGVHASHLENLAAAAKSNAKAAEDSAEASKANAEAAREAAIYMKSSVEVQIAKERARIRLELGKLNLEAEPLAFHGTEYILFCYGATPAFIEESWTNLEITDSEKAPDSSPHVPMPLDKVFLPSPGGIKKNAILFSGQKVSLSDQ